MDKLRYEYGVHKLLPDNESRLLQKLNDRYTTIEAAVEAKRLEVDIVIRTRTDCFYVSLISDDVVQSCGAVLSCGSCVYAPIKLFLPADETFVERLPGFSIDRHD